MFNPNIQPPVASPDDNGRQFNLGIASFVLGLVTLASFSIGFMMVYQALSLADPRTIVNDIDALLNLRLPVTMMICCSPILSLAGTGLGIVAVRRNVDKKIYGVIGLVINGLFLLVFCLITAVGTVLG